MSYHGWKNYETWVTNLDLIDRDHWLERAQEEDWDVDELKIQIEEEVRELVMSGITDPFALHCMRIFFNGVDFFSIACGILE